MVSTIAMGLLAALAGAPTARACTSAADCSLGGECVAGVCHCYATWKGQNCSELNLLPATATVGKYPAAWARPGVQSSWGGRPLFDNDTGTWHLYAADMTGGCGLKSWRSNSAIAHAVASNPAGPYQYVDQTLTPWAHNPAAHRAPDGASLIYHIGDGASDPGFPLYTNCSNGTHGPTRRGTDASDDGGPRTQPAATPPPPPAQVGDLIMPTMLLGSGPAGPWEKFVPSRGDHPPPVVEHSCTNPGVFFFPNGTTLLVCKDLSVAVADSWKGPYYLRSVTPMVGEDGVIWRAVEDGSFHMLYHTTDYPARHRGIGTTAWSADGLRWTSAFPTTPNTTVGQTYPSFPKGFQMVGGTVWTADRRERHQLAFDAAGRPAYLFNGVQVGGTMEDFTFTSVQPIATS